LFSKDKEYELTEKSCAIRISFFSVRKTGYRQCVGYLLSNTRLRLDDFYQFYPADKLFDLFITAPSTNNPEVLTKDHVNVILTIRELRKSCSFILG
jgi:hypothetical protein